MARRPIEKPRYILVIDGEDPDGWKPFNASTLPELKRRSGGHHHINREPPPPREIIIDIEVCDKSNILEDDYSRVIGLIIDGNVFFGDDLETRHKSVNISKIVVSKVISDNPELTQVGFSIYAATTSTDSERMIMVRQSLEEIRTKLDEGNIRSRIAIVPSEDIFVWEVQNELVRYALNEPFVYFGK